MFSPMPRIMLENGKKTRHTSKGRFAMSDTEREPKLLLPFLKPLYDILTPLSWPLVRCATGLILAVHG